MKTTLSAALAIVTLTAPALAHEFWIMPSTFTPATDEVFHISLWHGERFAGDRVPRNNATIESFTIAAPGVDAIDPAPVVGLDGRLESVGRTRRDGVSAVTYRSKPIDHELDAQAFEAYLREEGLDSIIDARAERGESSLRGRELYSRCAKAIITSGTTCDSAADAPTGMTLEIVVATPINSLAAEQAVEAEVLLDGEPLAQTRVVAASAADPANLVELKSDDSGRIRLTPGASGDWMLTTIHMRRASDLTRAEWESFWASTTFHIPASASAAPPAGAGADEANTHDTGA